MSRLGFMAYSLNDRIYMMRVCKPRRSEDQGRVPITVTNHSGSKLVFIVRSYSNCERCTIFAHLPFVLLSKELR